MIKGDDFSIEVSMGDRPDVTGISLHVRGDDMAAAVDADILIALNLRAIDTATGE